MKKKHRETRQGGTGKSFPLGARVLTHGVNFSIFSQDAKTVELLLFNHAEDRRPSRVLPFDAKKNRTGDYWHLFVPDLKPGQIYAYRVSGPLDADRGLYFDADKILIDPYGRALIPPRTLSRKSASESGSNIAASYKSVVADPRTYDWQGDALLRTPFSQTVIYELHVNGFTRHENSGVEATKRGTFSGLVEKIPYLKDLGVTAVELLPIFQFDPEDAPLGLTNYWGYAPISFFVPHHAYSQSREPLAVLDEFRDMVKAFHRAGIEVLLDVVYNHTAEGNHLGPTYSLRGFQNNVYYMLDKKTKRFANYSGTGNTLNANHPVVRRMIVDSLHYWVQEMHVDGFRFDLASILSRDSSGRPLENPPVLEDIDSDPVLAGAKLIAEAWDAGGLYDVGKFIGDHWKEWNGLFRDDVRRFIRSDPGFSKTISKRILGSPDLYAHKTGPAGLNINFVTCHDGFTLNDLVSYNEKHNAANREQNKDGLDLNYSWNGGVEGPSDDPEIQSLRLRQIKNFFVLTLLSIGTPMISMGDEIRRTQNGNNNAYCQDSPLSWMNWDGVRKEGELLRFVKKMIRLRTHTHPDVLGNLSLPQVLREASVQWHGVKLGTPDFSHESRSLAFTAVMWEGVYQLHVMMNAYWEPLTFDLPPLETSKGEGWKRWVDTSLGSPEDFSELHRPPAVRGLTYRLAPRSIVILYASLGR